METTDLAPITFDRNVFRESVFAAIGGKLPHMSDRLRSLALARTLAVQVTLDTLRPVLEEMLGHEKAPPSGIGISVTKAKLYRGRKALVFHDPAGPVSVALALEGGGSFKVATFGNDGVTEDMAVEALGTYDMRREFFSSLQKSGDDVVLTGSLAGVVSGSIDAVAAVARFTQILMPQETAKAVADARAGGKCRYISPEAENPFLMATASSLDVDGFVVSGFTKECLKILWEGSLTAEFASRLDRIQELTDAILQNNGPGFVDNEASWATESEGVRTLVLDSGCGAGMRIDVTADKLTASLVDFETASPRGPIGVFQVRGGRLSALEKVPYDGRLCHALAVRHFQNLDDQHGGILTQRLMAASLSP